MTAFRLMLLRYPIILILSVFMLACSTPDKHFLDKATTMGEQLMDTMAQQKYNETVRLYDPAFFERIDHGGWITILKRVNEKLGTYKSREITAHRVTRGFSSRGTATTVLVYHVHHEKDFTVQKLTFLSDEKGENMRVVGHYIDYPQQEGEPFR